ncbi:MotE family protein [Pectinatus sottacetonis]|uniref:MotE family protein n=1 Tax=Pectinatus sottacetonis TaxID=1002795 RepID=UPI001E2A9AEE|nr:magnesium transporter MgtE [Pectinatus sottacetonis]
MNINSEQVNSKTKGQKVKSTIKKIIIIILILILLAGGFFLGIYLRVLDPNKMNSSMHLYNWPIIGNYFEKPTEKNNPPGTKEQKVNVSSGSDATNNNLATGSDVKNPNDSSKPMVLTKKQLEKQKKAYDEQVKRRVGKVARIYAQMDPPKAAVILTKLDDNVVASILQKMDPGQSAKILENFVPARSAQITQTMYDGITPPTMPQLNGAANAANQ